VLTYQFYIRSSLGISALDMAMRLSMTGLEQYNEYFMIIICPPDMLTLQYGLVAQYRVLFGPRKYDDLVKNDGLDDI